MLRWNVCICLYFLLPYLIQGFFCPAHNKVRNYAGFAKQPYGLLCRLGFHLFYMGWYRKVCYEYIRQIVFSELPFQAFHRKKERYVFIVSNSAANLNNRNITALACILDSSFYLI